MNLTRAMIIVSLILAMALGLAGCTSISPAPSAPVPAPAPEEPGATPTLPPEQLHQQHFEQGNVYLEQNEWSKAIVEYSKAIELNPEFADAYANRAVAYNEKGDYYELAILDCEKALELYPLIKLDSSLARAYLKRGEYNAQFVKVGYLGSDNYEDNKKNRDKAVADFTRAIELNPQLAEAYKGRADCYTVFFEDSYDFRMTVYYDQTIEDYSMAIVLDPRNATYYKKELGRII